MRTLAGSLCVALWLSSPSAAADLTGLLRDLKAKDPDLRRAAASGLRDLGAEAKPAVDALVKALKDEDLFVRRFSAQALGEIGREADGAVSALSSALRDREKRVVEAAAHALGKFGSAAVRPLTDVVKDRNRSAEVRRIAIESLGKIGPPAKSAVPTLVEILKGRGPRRPMATDMEQVVRLEVVQTLGRIGPDAQEAIKTLEELDAARNRDRTFKAAVKDALRKIKQ